MDDKKNKKIEEALSIADLPNDPNYNVDPELQSMTAYRPGFSTNSNNRATFMHRPENKPFIYRGWQGNIVDIIKSRRHDIFVNVAPAAGKTGPTIQGWIELVQRNSTHLRTFADIPKILWICPTRQLTNQIYFDDFRKKFVELITQIAYMYRKNSESMGRPLTEVEKGRLAYSILPQVLIHSNRTLEQLLLRSDGYLTGEQIAELTNNAINNWLFLQNGDAKKGNSSTAIAYVCTYQFAESYIKAIENLSVVAVDETQEYFQKATTLTVGDAEPRTLTYAGQSIEEKALVLTKIFKSTPKTPKTTLVMLTGSMNQQAVTELVQHINKTYNRNLDIINPSALDTKLVTTARNRSTVILKTHSGMKTTQDMIHLIKNVVNEKQRGSLIILFSVGHEKSYNTMKKNIMSLTSDLTRVLPIIAGYRNKFEQDNQGNIVTKNPNRISASDVKNTSLLEKLGVKTNVRNYTTPAHINDEPNIKPLENLRLSHTSDEQELMDMMRQKSGRDHRLPPCIVRGYGYIAGGSARLKAMGMDGMNNEDTRFVQRLFQEGKIYAVLATDAVGVGANLDVTHLYIPSLTKYHGVGQGPGGATFGPIDDSSLVQIINRAGRKGDRTATIYVDPDDYDRVKKLLDGDPQSEVTYVSAVGELKDSERNKAVTTLSGLLKHLFR